MDLEFQSGAVRMGALTSTCRIDSNAATQFESHLSVPYFFSIKLGRGGALFGNSLVNLRKNCIHPKNLLHLIIVPGLGHVRTTSIFFGFAEAQRSDYKSQELNFFLHEITLLGGHLHVLSTQPIQYQSKVLPVFLY